MNTATTILIANRKKVMCDYWGRLLTDPSPRMGKAVMKGDQLYLYDVTGKLVDTRQMPTQNLKPMLDEMRAAKNNVSADKALVAKATGLPGMDVDALLEMAKAKNARIEDLNSQLKKVEMDIDQPSQGGDGKGPSAFTVSYTLDMRRNLMLGGELVDRNTGQLLSKSVMQYTHRPDTNDDMIRMVYTEDYHQDAKTGRREKTITTCQYKRFTLTNNLN